MPVMLNVKKTLVSSFIYPYAVSVYDSDRGKRVLCATEYQGKCIGFSAQNCDDIEEIWPGPGGTMTICPVGNDAFFVTHEFYKGFNSAKAHGIDELVTIEGFHGNLMKVYKKTENGYEVIYSYPIVFGHPIWCGKMLGKPRIIIGYKEANSGLFVLTPK